jgi:hypothetical protein
MNFNTSGHSDVLNSLTRLCFIEIGSGRLPGGLIFPPPNSLQRTRQVAAQLRRRTLPGSGGGPKGEGAARVIPPSPPLLNLERIDMISR